VRFVFIDSVDANKRDTSATKTISVFHRNQPPAMTYFPNAGPFNIAEGDSLNIRVTAVDVDGAGLPTVTASNLPLNCISFNGLVNQLFVVFEPSFTQAGSYQIRIVARDVAGAADTDFVTINVSEAGNQAAQFTTVLSDPVPTFVGVPYGLNLSASDPEGGVVAISAVIPPAMTGAAFAPTGNGTAFFGFTPDFAQIGSSYLVHFVATDPLGAADTLSTHFTVSSFMRGDADANKQYEVTDIVFLVSYLFRGGQPPQPLVAGDVDMSGVINPADIAYLINYLYKAGPRPPQ